MFTTLRGPMTSEQRGLFYAAALRLRDPGSRVPRTPAPGCEEPSWHCVRFRDRALSWPATLRSKQKVPSLGRHGPEARALARGRILGPGHLGRCLCAVCKPCSYNMPLDHVEGNAGGPSVLEKRLLGLGTLSLRGTVQHGIGQVMPKLVTHENASKGGHWGCTGWG